VRKLQSAPAFHLKGSGWYITDYARKDQGSSEKEEGAKSPEVPKSGDGGGGNAAPQSEGKSEKTPEQKTDQKVETKAETKAEGKSEGGSTASQPAGRARPKPGTS
jgi:hypothetical protein